VREIAKTRLEWKAAGEAPAEMIAAQSLVGDVMIHATGSVIVAGTKIASREIMTVTVTVMGRGESGLAAGGRRTNPGPGTGRIAAVDGPTSPDQSDHAVGRAAGTRGVSETDLAAEARRKRESGEARARAPTEAKTGERSAAGGAEATVYPVETDDYLKFITYTLYRSCIIPITSILSKQKSKKPCSMIDVKLNCNYNYIIKDFI